MRLRLAAALAVVQVACASAPRPLPAPAGAPPAAPGATPVPGPARPAEPPPPPGAPEGAAAAAPPRRGADDDAEIEQRVAEDSEEVREVQDAEDRVRPDAGGEEVAGVDVLAELPELGGDLASLRAGYDIPIDVNEVVVRYVRFFLGPEVRPLFVRWLSRLNRYGPRFRELLRREGVPEDTVFLAMVESGFANRATSRARAVGPWQFLAETARSYGLRRDSWVDERRDPEKSAAAAARFLAALRRATGDWRLAWAAYNAGPGRIARATAAGERDFWALARAEGALPAETRAYVPKIMAAAILAKHAEAFGIAADEVAPSRWVPYREVVIAGRTPLSTLARAAGVPVDALLDLNPELRRTSTPPRRYRLKIPRERAAAFAAAWPRIARRAGLRAGAVLQVTARPQAAPSRLARGGGAAARAPASRRAVEVRRGDSLWSLARRLEVSLAELAASNGIRDPDRHTIRAGEVLVVPR